MKFSIGTRLFLTILLAFGAIALVGLGLVRWRLSGAASPAADRAETVELGRLAQALADQYRHGHGWSVVPAGRVAREAWLRERWLASTPTGRAETGSPALGYRIGLLDRDGRYLAGRVAGRPLVVLASIDRVRRDIVVDGTTVGYLLLAKPRNPDDALVVAFLLQQQRNLSVLAAIALLASIVAAAWLAAGFRRPIAQLVRGARLLGKARYDTRLDVRRGDELGELAASFNQLAARLEEAEQSRRQWVADTSHELRTPLAVLRGQLEALGDGIRAATPDNVALMLRQTLALTRLVEDLHALAQADAGPLACRMESVDAWALAVEVCDAFAPRLREAGLVLSVGAPPARSWVRGDDGRLRQVLGNLLENSARHTSRGGRVAVSAHAAGDELHIIVEDSAPGVPAQALQRLGERFYRPDAARSRQRGGAGLGLAVCRGLVDAHGGRMGFSASTLGGLRVDVVLPLEGTHG